MKHISLLFGDTIGNIREEKLQAGLIGRLVIITEISTVG